MVRRHHWLASLALTPGSKQPALGFRIARSRPRLVPPPLKLDPSPTLGQLYPFPPHSFSASTWRDDLLRLNTALLVAQPARFPALTLSPRPLAIGLGLQIRKNSSLAQDDRQHVVKSCASHRSLPTHSLCVTGSAAFHRSPPFSRPNGWRSLSHGTCALPVGSRERSKARGLPSRCSLTPPST